MLQAFWIVWPAHKIYAAYILFSDQFAALGKVFSQV